MAHTQHVVAVWLDHVEARIFQIEPEGFEASRVVAPHRYLTRKAEEQGPHALHERYFKAVAVALKSADAVLVVGPGPAKLDFLRYVHRHDNDLSERIVGVETLDHPTDRQIVAYVREYFDPRARASRKVEHGV